MLAICGQEIAFTPRARQARIPVQHDVPVRASCGAACSPALAAGMTSTQALRNKGEAMPFYQFTVPADSATARKKAEVAAAVTAAHAQITGAPPEYVNCS